jgi:hypothetical protein
MFWVNMGLPRVGHAEYHLTWVVSYNAIWWHVYVRNATHTLTLTLFDVTFKITIGSITYFEKCYTNSNSHTLKYILSDVAYFITIRF